MRTLRWMAFNLILKEGAVMERDFGKVMYDIIEAAPELKEDLENRSEFWAPEILWYNLSAYVNEHITPDSSSSKAVKVYSILCDCSEEEMKRRFEEKGC